jgi:hypothetical protein
MKPFHGLSLMNNARHTLPPKPREPDPSECCQRNCVNCVYVYYERALERWKKKVEEIEADPTH